MTLYDFYDAEFSKEQYDPIYEYDKILYSNLFRKNRKRKVESKHHRSDRMHGKPRQMGSKTWKDYCNHPRCEDVKRNGKMRNRKIDFISQEDY